MIRTRRLDATTRAAALALAMAMLVVACGGSGQAAAAPTEAASVSPAGPAASAAATPVAASTTPAATPAGGSGGTEAEIAGFAFSPASLTIPVGATVTWINNDSAPHTVTADDASFESPTLSNGATFSNTFAEPGTFAFHCAIHPRMAGTVTVTP